MTKTNGALPTRADLLAAGINIVVAIPLERVLTSKAFECFWSIACRGWPSLTMGYGRTDVQRNHFAKTLLQTDYTHVLMLDTDHMHPENIVEAHAKRVLDDPNKRVIAGLNFRRGEPFDPLAFVAQPNGTMHTLAEWPAKQCIQVHAVGHGSLLVHRSVFEEIDPPWWAYDYGRADESIYPSEDMYFCYLVREAGIPIWVDTAISSPHMIDNVVTESVFRAWVAQHPELVR